jgi:hypothetical protein
MRRRNQGSVLIAVLVVLLLAAMAALWMTLTLQDYARMQGKVRDEIQAFYTAEAGAYEVVSWFNSQGGVIAQSAPSFSLLFHRDSQDQYTYLAGVLTSYVPGTGPSAPSSILPVLRDTSGTELGRITSLQLTRPSAAQSAATPNLLAIVRSESETRNGGRKRVLLFLTYHRLRLEGAPGVILSRDLISFSGNVTPHWGQVWAHDNLMMMNLSQMISQNQDPWLKYKSESSIVFPSNWGATKWGMPTQSISGGTAIVGFNQPCALPNTNASIRSNYDQMIWQGQSLSWPVYDYYAIKDLARRKGHYYSTDAAGNVYRDGIEDADHRVADLRELNVAGDRTNWAAVDYDVVFVDTIDNQAPAADGSNLATLRLSGSGFSWKGFYYIGANLDVAGMGTPSAIRCWDPDDPRDASHGTMLNLFMDGILCIQGWYDKGSGNHQIYGSIYAELGVVGTGTLDVYYNSELANGFPVSINNKVELAMEKVEI